jgi:hypothetical protein
VKLSGNNVESCEGVPASDCIIAGEIAAELITLFFK